MSDIEDYAYSPYDDLEDILYDADPAPELADDLAEHALHSPVYLDEIAGYELQEYFSDWEYYSDDYMDDDPALEKREHVERRPKAKRGKKRKLVDTIDIPPIDLNDATLITRSIRGTVWAKPGKPEPPIHSVGQGDTISLMKDWKQVFSIQDDGWGRRVDTTDSDESWAKDMSLADMGLQPLQSQKSFEQEPLEGEDEDYDEDGDGDVSDGEDEDVAENEELVEDTGELAKMNLDLQEKGRQNSDSTEGDDGGGLKAPIGRRTSTLRQVVNASSPEMDAAEDETPRKRRRYQPELPSPPNSNKSVATEARNGQPQDKSQTQVLPNKKTKLQDSASTKPSKKRKASEEPPMEEGKSTTSTRTKRVAAARTNGAVVSQTIETTSRQTRSRSRK